MGRVLQKSGSGPIVQLAKDLHQALDDGARVWYDAIHLHPGESWYTKVAEEIEASSVFVVILSPDMMTSDWVNSEISIALRRRRNTSGARLIIPVLYRECVIPDELVLRQIVSFLPPRRYEEAFNELLQGVRAISG